jgi:hypothetical protein
LTPLTRSKVDSRNVARSFTSRVMPSSKSHSNCFEVLKSG